MEQTNAPTKSTWKNIIRWAIVVVAIATAFDLGLGYLIQSIFSKSMSGNTLTPFQNHYLAFDQIYITSEFIISNNNDPGRWSRLFSEGVFIMLGWAILLFVLRVIPATRNVSAYLFRYGTGTFWLYTSMQPSFQKSKACSMKKRTP